MRRGRSKKSTSKKNCVSSQPPTRTSTHTHTHTHTHKFACAGRGQQNAQMIASTILRRNMSASFSTRQMALAIKHGTFGIFHRQDLHSRASVMQEHWRKVQGEGGKLAVIEQRKAEACMNEIQARTHTRTQTHTHTQKQPREKKRSKQVGSSRAYEQTSFGIRIEPQRRCRMRS